MKNRLVLTLSLAIPMASNAQTAKWWRSLAPNQSQAVSCELANDDQSLGRLLRPLGWDESRFPNIDWARFNVVVIAPNLFHRGYHLGFIEERKLDRKVEFRWGWEIPGQSAGRPGGVYIGAAGEGKEAIVISFPRDDLTGRSRACPETQ